MVETRRKMTEAEFVALPDTGVKRELVDGEVMEVPTYLEHGFIAVTLIGLMIAAGARKLGALFDANTGFRMANGNIRVPDLSFIRRERLPGGIPRDQFGEGAPNLCVEIISPSERTGGVFQKMGEYFDSGAQEVWLLWPETQRVAVYRSLDDVQFYGPDDELSGGELIPTFRCRVADLFSTE